MPSTTPRRPNAFIALLFAFSVALIASLGHPALAQFTDPNCCGPSFIVTGEIHHYKTPPGIEVAAGATAPGVFGEQVYGSSFTASVAGLPAGKYTIEIDLAETYHRAAGQRVFNIAAGSTPIAVKLDVFQAAGGFARPSITMRTRSADRLRFSSRRSRTKRFSMPLSSVMPTGRSRPAWWRRTSWRLSIRER
jgi:hypothetical protein